MAKVNDSKVEVTKEVSKPVVKKTVVVEKKPEFMLCKGSFTTQPTSEMDSKGYSKYYYELKGMELPMELKPKPRKRTPKKVVEDE